MKELYTFTVKKGDIDKKVFIQKPGAEMQRLISLKYSAELGKLLAMGVLSQEDMRRIILDSGGLKHSKGDRTNRNALVQEILKAENKFQLLQLEGKDVSKITRKILDLREDLHALESRLTKIFGHSAERLADINALLWAVTQLTFWRDNDSRVFPGETDDDAVSFYYECVDNDNLEKLAGEKAFIFLQGFLLEQLKTEEDFKEKEKEIDGDFEAEEILS